MEMEHSFSKVSDTASQEMGRYYVHEAGFFVRGSTKLENYYEKFPVLG